MKLNSLCAAVVGLLYACVSVFMPKRGRIVGRMSFKDAFNYSAFPYRMGAGFPGDVNRSHPASIEPCVLDATNPPPFAGFPVLVNTTANTVRQLLAGDTAVNNVYGVAVRAFPFQTSTSSQAYGQVGFGTTPLQANMPVDVLRQGYIMVQMNTAAGAVTKGGPVFVWVAATSGGHTQGGFESAASAGNTATLDTEHFFYNGPADANGVVELCIR